MSRRAVVTLTVVLLAAVIGAVRTGGGLDQSSVPTADTSVQLETGREATDAQEPPSGLPVVSVDRLPVEAADTITLIRSGGPFPFDRDGTVFQNREGLLPDRPTGYYREYTVITPDADDRGARRIVAGGDGELYYTADHYSSFVAVANGSKASP